VVRIHHTLLSLVTTPDVRTEVEAPLRASEPDAPWHQETLPSRATWRRLTTRAVLCSTVGLTGPLTKRGLSSAATLMACTLPYLCCAQRKTTIRSRQYGRQAWLPCLVLPTTRTTGRSLCSNAARVPSSRLHSSVHLGCLLSTRARNSNQVLSRQQHGNVECAALPCRYHNAAVS
jgi:hypothetical protein